MERRVPNPGEDMRGGRRLVGGSSANQRGGRRRSPGFAVDGGNMDDFDRPRMGTREEPDTRKEMET
jgi:hypothetical protein